MVNITDPVTQWALMVLISVVMGTFLLMAVAFFRRWQQIRYTRYVHNLQRRYRPVLARLLRGEQRPTGVEALRELPHAQQEILLDPLLSRRKLTERQLVFLQSLCVELGLIALWQTRLSGGKKAARKAPDSAVRARTKDRAAVRHLLRAKSIRNLGTLRHRPSWPLLLDAVNDRHRDIQLVALRSLAAVGAAESFPALRQRLRAAIKQERPSLPLQGLLAAMAGFDLRCAASLAPSLHHPDPEQRLHAVKILRTMVRREANGQPHVALTPEALTPEIFELLLTGLAADPSAEVRARAAEVIVFLADQRVTSALQSLLLDEQWFVRLRSVRAIARLRQPAEPLHMAIRECLQDAHWRVREAAILTFIALGLEGKRQLYEHFLSSPNHSFRGQIVEAIERTGLMATLVEAYSRGANGLDALMVERLASETAPLGLSAVLRTLPADVRKRFLDRFLPYAVAKTQFLEESQTTGARGMEPLPPSLFPPFLAA